ncbi:MAG TPA: porin family protein [Arenibacter sp.]|nr:porin family protein [Arenibacter sp.]
MGQEPNTGPLTDANYLEDQFYVGLTYNFLMDLPTDGAQRNLSYGLQGGFIKDIPLNLGRTFGLGIGVGYGVNSYYTNLRALDNGTELEYVLLDSDTRYKRNKIETHVLEMPLQFRWRNSTPEEYKFWRIYAGMKFGYVFANRSKYVSATEKFSFKNTDVREFQYGIALNVGYNTFNIHVYYALRSLFRDGTSLSSGEPINMRPLQVGLIFYIL